VTRGATEAIGRTPHEDFTAALDSWITRCFGADEEEADVAKMEVILMGDGERMAGMEEDMTQRHTEGPWMARGNRIYAPDGGEIAVATKADPKHRAQAEDNARLIAVAPDLFKALEDLFADINNDRSSIGIWVAGHPHIAAAHAALAKAREE
jgi:hypothetical protein